MTRFSKITVAIISTATLSQAVETITPTSWNYILTHSRTVDKIITDINKQNPQFFLDLNSMQAEKSEQKQQNPWVLDVEGQKEGVASINNGYLAFGTGNLYLVTNSIEAQTATHDATLEFRENAVVGNVPIVENFSLTGAYITKSQNETKDNTFLKSLKKSDESLLMGNFYGQKIILKGGYSQNKKEKHSTSILLNKYEHNEDLSITTDIKHFITDEKKTTELTNTISKTYNDKKREITLSLKNLKTTDENINDGLVTSVAKWKVNFHKDFFMELGASRTSEFSVKAVNGYSMKFKLAFFEFSRSFNYSEDLENLPILDSTIWTGRLIFKF